jgi:short-subunit dehydrogenase
MSKGRWNDRTVVITGASAGIGLACARRFASEGANIVLVARGKSELEKARAEMARLGPVLAVAVDVADPSSATKAFAAAIVEFGAIHVLVNNAGFHTRGRVEMQKPEDLATMVDVNLRAPIVWTQAALPHLRTAITTNRDAKCAIINIASLAGMLPTPGGATYSATKFGLRAFSLALAEELRGTRITSSVVSPGPVQTQFILADLDDVSDLTMSQPMCTPEEVAELVMDCALDGKAERTTPRLSGALATAAYVAPPLSRALRPLLERRGRANKEKLRAAKK